MTITVKFFASLKEKMGADSVSLSKQEVETIQDVWRKLMGSEMPNEVLCAINRAYANREQPVSAGDEVAFFPPVSGG